MHIQWELSTKVQLCSSLLPRHLCFTSPLFANKNIRKHLKTKGGGNLFGLGFHSYQDLTDAGPGTAVNIKITPYKNYSAINGINKQIIIIIIIMTSYATAGLK